MIWKPQPLSSGGLILSYQCSNQCRHCLYASSPAWQEWAAEKDMDAILTELSKQKRFLTGIHIGGGEPLLKPDATVYTIQKAVALDVPLDYVETNAFWCWNDDRTAELFTRLKTAGLPAVLVSVSPFHLEFVPMERVHRAVRIGKKIFGSGGVITYTPYFYRQFEEIDQKKPLPLEDYIEAIGNEEASLTLADQYGLIPNGRVPTQLAHLFQHQPAYLYANETCERELSNPHHIHIDLYGNYIAGLCAGISIGNARDLNSLYNGFDLDATPVLEKLITGGVESLLAWATDRYGYEENPEGYIAKCHLCLDIRRYLVKTDTCFAELVPLEFYENLE